MPLAVLKEGNDKKEYLKSLFETTYFKDIIDRYHFKKTEALVELSTLLSVYVGELLNSKKLSNTYKSKTENKIDSQTINYYINAFKDSYIIREVNRYDVKEKT